MYEQYTTIGRDQFSLLTGHAHQSCTMCNNKYAIPEFPI